MAATNPLELKQLGEDNVRRFAATIARLFCVERAQFDATIACGNTGVYMAELARMTLVHLGKDAPTVLRMPIRRFKNAEAKRKFDSSNSSTLKHRSRQADPVRSLPEIVFDNAVLLPGLRDEFAAVPTCRRFLFVDDEIHSSLTVRSALDVLQRLQKVAEYPSVTIVAENHNLLWPYHDEKMFLHFLPFRLGSGAVNLVARAVSDDAASACAALSDDGVEFKQYGNLLLRLPLKDDHGAAPRFTTEFVKLAERRIPGFALLCAQHRRYIDGLIREGINSMVPAVSGLGTAVETRPHGPLHADLPVAVPARAASETDTSAG